MKNKRNIYYQTGLSMLVFTIFQLCTAYIFKSTGNQIIKIVITSIIGTFIMFSLIYIYEKLRK